VADSDFPTDITALYTRLEILGEDGKIINIDKGLYPHHAVFASASRFAQNSIVSCNGKPLKVPTIPVIIGAAAETPDEYLTDREGRVNSGFYLPKNGKIAMQIDIVNYKDYDQSIYLVPEIEYLAGKPKHYLDTDKYLLSPGTCDSPQGALSGTSIKPPPGQKKFELAGSEMTLETDGYLITASKSSSSVVFTLYH
jgi:hypothetical protein